MFRRCFLPLDNSIFTVVGDAGLDINAMNNVTLAFTNNSIVNSIMPSRFIIGEMLL